VRLYCFLAATQLLACCFGVRLLPPLLPTGVSPTTAFLVDHCTRSYFDLYHERKAHLKGIDREVRWRLADADKATALAWLRHVQQAYWRSHKEQVGDAARLHALAGTCLAARAGGRDAG
jgi:hypothetical protein